MALRRAVGRPIVSTATQGSAVTTSAVVSRTRKAEMLKMLRKVWFLWLIPGFGIEGVWDVEAIHINSANHGRFLGSISMPSRALRHEQIE